MTESIELFGTTADKMYGWRRPPSSAAFHCYDKDRRSLCTLWRLHGAPPDNNIENGVGGHFFPVCAVCAQKAPSPCPSVSIIDPKPDAAVG